MPRNIPARLLFATATEHLEAVRRTHPFTASLRARLASHFGSFELLRRLGAGATAEVFLASGPNPVDADLVALKIVLPHLADDAALRESLIKEAKLCERIQHRNVARIYGVGEAEGRPYLAMEY